MPVVLRLSCTWCADRHGFRTRPSATQHAKFNRPRSMLAAPHRSIPLEQSHGQDRRPGVAVSRPEATKKDWTSQALPPPLSIVPHLAWELQGGCKPPQPIDAPASLMSTPPTTAATHAAPPWARLARNDRCAYRFLFTFRRANSPQRRCTKACDSSSACDTRRNRSRSHVVDAPSWAAAPSLLRSLRSLGSLALCACVPPL